MMHSAHCRDLLSSLSEYADGVLQDEMCREIERHIAQCENCRIVVDTLKKTISLYHSTSGEADVPSGVRERLFRRLELDQFLKDASSKS